jgi:hypothetical protein
VSGVAHISRQNVLGAPDAERDRASVGVLGALDAKYGTERAQKPVEIVHQNVLGAQEAWGWAQ